MRVSILEEHGDCVDCGYASTLGLAGYITVLITSEDGHIKMGPYCSSCMPDEHLGIYKQLATKKRKKAKHIRKDCQRQDLSVAGEAGGRVQPASGALPGRKGDVRNLGRFRVETKLKYSKQATITLRELSKIRGECELSVTPVLVLDFVEKVTGRRVDRWAMIPHKEWLKYADTDEDS